MTSVLFNYFINISAIRKLNGDENDNYNETKECPLN